MDEYQHRLLVALERLAGRGGEVVPPGGRLDELIAILGEIRDRLPGRVPPSPEPPPGR